MPNVEHFHQDASSATLVANVFKPDYTEREFSCTLSDVGHLGLYTYDCVTMVAGDLVQIYDSSISKYIGAYIYNPLVNLSAAAIADAVWEEDIATHKNSTTFGGKNQNHVPSDLSFSLSSIISTTEDTNSVVTGLNTLILDVPTNAEFNARTLPSADYVVVTDTIAGVTLVGTCTTNTDLAAVKTETDKIASIVTAVITNASGTDIAADIIAIKAETSDIVADTAEIQGKLPTNKIMGSSDVDNHDTDIDSILADTNELQTDDLPTKVDAIKAITDQLTFTAGTVDANIATGGLGTGTVQVDYYVFTNESAETGAIANVNVYVTSDEAGTAVVASGMTDSTGKVTFYLDAGTYYMWRSKAGYSFDNPDEETVSE
jgi:hypothetical protein